MRTFLSLALLAMAPAFGQSGMTAGERKFLVEQLEKSKKDMLASITGLSAEQWRFKTAADRWSVQECAEHIILAEDLLFNLSQQAMKNPAGSRLESANEAADHKMVATVLDRSQKASAPEPLVPSAKYATAADAVREFTLLRDRSIAYAKSTSDDLRAHSANGPAGPMDSYQFLLAMAAHSGRHTLQIREVEANAAYPKTKMSFLVIYSLAKGNVDELTKDQMATLYQHAAYVEQGVHRNLIEWGGRTADPKQPRGIAVLSAASESEAREYVDHDPAVKSGLFKFTMEPFISLSAGS
jgi:hypothetical protein